MAELVDYRQSGSDKETFTTQCGVDKYGNVLINLIRNDEEPMEAQVYLTLSLFETKELANSLLTILGGAIGELQAEE